MERLGADKYPAAFVQKIYKELEAAGKAGLDNTDDVESSAAVAASGSKDIDGADGSKTSNGAKKITKAKKNKEITETNEDVVVKEEEMADGDDEA